MNSRPTDRVIKRGSFLYDGSVRCNVEIIQTDFRPGVADDEAPVEDAYGEFLHTIPARRDKRRYLSADLSFMKFDT